MTTHDTKVMTITKKVQSVCPEILTFDNFFNQPDAVTLEHVLKTVLATSPGRYSIVLCNEGVILGDMFSADPLKSALWLLAEPLSRQPVRTVDLLINVLAINQ